MPDTPNGSGDNPGRRPDDTNGAHLGDMNTRSVRFEDVEDPIDLVAVQADDELINALAAGMSVSAPGRGGYDADDRLAALLAAWKADVDEDPIPELVDIDTAVSTVRAARRQSSRRARHLVPVAAAAAFIVLSIGGLSVGSYNAQPDDVLWGVSKVLYSERAESVQAAVRVQEHIAKAKQALVAGQPSVAARELAQTEDDLAVIRPEEGKSELVETQEFLVAKAAETPPGQSTNPGSPLSTQPSRPVPPGASVPPEPSQEASSAGPESSSSGTPAPGAPESAESSDSTDSPGSTSRPEYDVRRAPVAPESGVESSTSPASPTREPGGGGADGQDPASPSPTATPEGSGSEPTATPEQSEGQRPSSTAPPSGSR